jgi:CheY-like chemotaxis protein
MPGRDVLVVDDEEQIRSLVARFLQKLGYVTHLAGSAAQALRMTERQGFDIVVADNDMPGMGGIELIRVLRARWPRCRFILMTGRIDAVVLGEMGAGPLLSKPFVLDDVRRVLDRVSEEPPRAP